MPELRIDPLSGHRTIVAGERSRRPGGEPRCTPAEPIDPDIDALRLNFRRAIAAELEMRISMAIAEDHLSDQDVRVAALAVIGALLEGLLGPLAPQTENAREAVQAITLFALRALGVVDARARGLVAQCATP